MTVIDVNDIGAKLKSLLGSIPPGEEIVISDAGKTVARVFATEEKPAPEFGYFKGEVRMADDFDTLPAEELAEWEK